MCKRLLGNQLTPTGIGRLVTRLLDRALTEPLTFDHRRLLQFYKLQITETYDL